MRALYGISEEENQNFLVKNKDSCLWLFYIISLSFENLSSLLTYFNLCHFQKAWNLSNTKFNFLFLN
ncbi:hypothetical protein L1987_46953 [Smallanthus sonchifolius]|uniref:Uncharacterized protein n=1 Tax=Smallanthus sonchifolius TaxID=185202 RepID=A0ACB9G130_9ASTR|nr:hypothetical protein L1987_46953 [Smallanthus sonchifolius]